ncbi:hypothetical protein FRC10_005578 [Ceratobasidium sp. 414]|nr:hypothetical protein FRC10_005578 [Ceratobasidium sp. 414]
MSCPPPLPAECYLEILRYVASPSTLCNFVHVNRQCRELALPLLYRSVLLARERSVRQFCQSVENNPSLAGLVRSFSIASSASPSDEHQEFLEGIHGALKNMVNLTDLSVRLVEQPPYQKRHWIFEGTIFQLKRLELRMDYDSALIDFLTRQPLLESLTLLGAVPDHLSSLRLELPPTALPRLAYFHGHYTQALALVPGRPIKGVHITQVDDAGEFEPSDVFVCLKDTVATIAQNAHLGPLEEVTMDDEDTDYGLLEVVLCNIPTVKSVNLYIPRQGHSWRRYSSPYWPSYIQSRVQNIPMQLERLNTSHDVLSHELFLQLAPLPVLPIFGSQNAHPFQFHGVLPLGSQWFTAQARASSSSRGQQESLHAYTMREWKQAFPALRDVQFLRGSNTL